MFMMKKVLLLCLVCVGVASCGNNEIKEAAYNYSYAVSCYRLDDAEHYCTEETSATLLKTARYLLQFVDSAYIASDTLVSIDILSVRRMSDSTAYAVYHKQTPTKDFSDTLQMRRRDGKWLVHAPIIKNNVGAQ